MDAFLPFLPAPLVDADLAALFYLQTCCRERLLVLSICPSIHAAARQGTHFLEFPFAYQLYLPFWGAGWESASYSGAQPFCPQRQIGTTKSFHRLHPSGRPSPVPEACMAGPHPAASWKQPIPNPATWRKSAQSHCKPAIQGRGVWLNPVGRRWHSPAPTGPQGEERMQPTPDLTMRGKSSDLIFDLPHGLGFWQQGELAVLTPTASPPPNFLTHREPCRPEVGHIWNSIQNWVYYFSAPSVQGPASCHYFALSMQQAHVAKLGLRDLLFLKSDQ